MSFDKLVVLLFGATGIAFTYWFFLMKKDEESVAPSGGNIDILVKGGYSPSVISLPKGKTTTITFFREDPSSCLEDVVLSGFKIRKFLPLNKKVSIEVTPQKSGEYPFECGMSMFHGKIVVRD